MRDKLKAQKHFSLDAADMSIVRCLLRDGRRPVTLIANDLGISELTVRNRLNRLVRERIIEFDVTTNPYQFGYSMWAMLEIHVELPRIRAVAELISREPRVHMVGIMTGAYDIFAAAVVRSNQDLVELIANRFSKIPGIMRVSSSTVLELVKRTVNFGFPESVYERPERNARSEIQARRSRLKREAGQ